MGHKVENGKSLGIGNSMDSKGFLFMRNPTEFWVGDNQSEQHDSILGSSRRKPEDIAVAGRLMVDEKSVLLHGSGSGTLGIDASDPTPAVDFLKKLIGDAEAEITAD